jgi:hypothetical protein
MPSLMPSLLKYFTIVGAMLLVGLISLNAVMDPGGPGPSLVKEQRKASPVRHDPQASMVERLRAEEAAQKEAEKIPASSTPVPLPVSRPAAAAASVQPAPLPAAPTNAAQPVPRTAAPVTQAAVAPPVQVAVTPPVEPAPEPSTTSTASLIGEPTADELRATRVAQEKAAAEKAEKARKKRLAKERARTRTHDDANAARQQDQYYYGQRVPPPPPGYAYAPRQTFGPFTQAQNGWGSGGWNGGWGRGW